MGMTYDQLMRQQNSARVVQERYDNVFKSWGMSAPAPVIGEPVDEYNRRLAVLAKKQLPEDHDLRKIQFRALADDAFAVVEPQLLAAVNQSAYNPNTVPIDGPLRRIEERDANGNTTYRYIGQRSFIHDLVRKGRRVVSFLTSAGFVDASGRGLR
jgi:hypothetical protein